jgi:DNA end-binding protein Ku
MSATALAPAPTRAHTSFTIGWGLLSIPVSVYTGTESTRVARKEFTMNTDGEWIPVGRSPIRTDTGEVIDSAGVTRRAQATSGEWVTLTDDDIADATSVIRGVGNVECFIKVTDVGRYLVEGQSQVRPRREKGKSNPAAEKAFALLLKAMKSRKVVALIKVALRGPARYALLDSEGTLSLILTADAIREQRPMDPVSISDAELAMAQSLIDAVGVARPVLTDTNAPLVQAWVDAKATGVVPATVATPEPVIDVMAAIQASIDAAQQKAA